MDDGAILIESGIESALIALASQLRARDYRFATPTPETHRRVLRNAAKVENPYRAAFGWSLPVRPEVLDGLDLDGLRRCALLTDEPNGTVRSRVRFSTLDNRLFAHSAYPTVNADSVFFGPDTFRFCRLIQQCVGKSAKLRRIVDIGCGSGAGGIIAAHSSPGAQLLLADINPLALAFARANARINGVELAACVLSDVFASIEGKADLIVSNPPYLADDAKRVYRHGGLDHGAELSVRILEESLPRLSQDGCLVLYTGSAIVSGQDTFWNLARTHLNPDTYDFHYSELDPDVFGEELDRPDYAAVERVAAVGLIVKWRTA